MPDPEVEQWRLKGELHLWRYVDPGRGNRGWHLNADKTTCESLTDLIAKMLASPWKTSKQIEVTVPKSMRNNPDRKWISASTLLLIFSREENNPDLWELKAEANLVQLTLGREKLIELQQSLVGLPDWKDDFAIGPTVNMRRVEDRKLWDAMCLWFWTKIA